MPSLTHYLSDDHAHCDQLFAEAENAVGQTDWAAAHTLFAQFRQATLRHFAREEEVLFPAFETCTGMRGGPTYVMREEHEQMRDALMAMADAVDRRDDQGYLGLSETLLMLMRQHNLKEEQMLYPMTDRALADQVDELLGRMVEQMA